MKYHKIPESSFQAELELDWDFLEHSRTYQLFGIIWNNFSQGIYPADLSQISWKSKAGNFVISYLLWV